MRAALLTLALLLAAPLAQAEEPSVLTLEDAKRQALEHNPQLQSDYQNIGLAQSDLSMARANYLPSIDANITAAGSQGYGRRDGAPTGNLDPRLAAGTINAPSVYDRAAAGIVVNQKLTDFGHTANLVHSARSALSSEQDRYEDRRQQLLLQVTADYFRAREAQSALQVANKVLNERALLYDQISLLQKNKLKSGLDVGFAGVSLDQAKLLLLQEQNAVDDAMAQLCSDIGIPASDSLLLADDGASELAPPGELALLLQQARDHRPELKSLEENLDAARANARAQSELGNPTLSLVGAAGTAPYGDTRLPQNYIAGAVNLSIPIFEGGRLRAQANEAAFKAQQAADALTSAQLDMSRDVRMAWLGARTTYQSIEVSRRLRANAESALELAASRYHLGLSSIVELNRAQLNEMDAELSYVKALYEYQISAAQLAYQTGARIGAAGSGA